MMKSLSKTLLPAALIAATLTGCTPNISPDSYNVCATGQVNQTLKATVSSCRVVKVQGTNSGMGTLGGAALGAIAGSAIGGGRMSLLTAVGGGLVGAGVGRAAEGHFTSQFGMEYIVKTANGSMMSVVQGPNPTFQRGQHVLVIFGQQARIIADPDYS